MVNNYLLDSELVISWKILYANDGDLFVLKPKGLPHWMQFVDAFLFREKTPDIYIPWKLVGSELKTEDVWNEMEEKIIPDLDSLFSILEYWKKRFPDLDEEIFTTHRFTILLDSSDDFKDQLRVILNDYLKKFVSQELKPHPSELLFTEQFEVIRNYVQRIVDIQGVQKVEVTTEQIINELKRTNVAFTDRDITIRLPEIAFILHLLGAIEIQKMDFVIGKSNEYVPKVTFRIINPSNFSIQAVSAYLDVKKPSRKEFLIGLRNYTYDYTKKKFTIHASNGDFGMMHFRDADVLARIFETFLHLWEEDNSGFYSRKKVKQTYDKLFPDKLDTDISKSAQKILTKIANYDDVAGKLIVLKGNFSPKDDSKWEFRILEDLP